MALRGRIWTGVSLALLLAGCDMNPDASPPEEVATLMDPVAIPEARADVVTDRFARLALQCVHREYPNKISHVMQGDGDALPPRTLTPAFYGCFDWHSAVHGHWLLVRILRTDPATPMKPAIIAALDQSFARANVEAEIRYIQGEGRASFERPYGLAWFLQLVAELEESDDPKLRAWRDTLRPLEAVIVEDVRSWLPKLAYPIRLGTHNQSAFAFGLMIDYARTVGDRGFEQMLVDKSREFHGSDRDCPLGYEPSGEDFLSPCLMEADLMRRIMPPADYADWLSEFLPGIPRANEDGKVEDRAVSAWLEPGIVRDPSDGKLVHLDGVNLSRAWALQGIAVGLPGDDPRRPALLASARLHRETGIAAVSDKNYEGSHWLGSFATYLETGRGLPGGKAAAAPAGNDTKP
ncbi:MAG: DUF2891 domain-containing protein [Blastomonas sp.]